MNIKELEIKLSQLTSSKKSLDEERSTLNFEKWQKLRNEIIEVERTIHKIKGFEFAEPCDFGINSYYKINLIADLNFSIVEIDDIKIKFHGVEELKFGGINDEVFETHEFNGKGIDIFGGFVIKNSSWKSKLQKQNSIHDCYDENYWKKLNHYIIRAKDGEFSCIAIKWELIKTE